MHIFKKELSVYELSPRLKQLKRTNYAYYFFKGDCERYVKFKKANSVCDVYV